MKSMRTFEVQVTGKLDYSAAEAPARSALPSSEGATLVAWYDRARKTGGPLEVCENEPRKCVRDYAASHGAEYRISVNGDALELYYSVTPADAAQLDRDGVLDAHQGLAKDQFDNVQGG